MRCCFIEVLIHYEATNLYFFHYEPAAGFIAPAAGSIGPAAGPIGPAADSIGPAAGPIGPAAGTFHRAGPPLRMHMSALCAAKMVYYR